MSIFAKWFAKRRYIWQEQLKAETLSINARSSERTVEKLKAFIQQLQAKADAADAQALSLEQGIKEVDEKMAAGFWQCENGHEWKPTTAFAGIEIQLPPKECYECHEPVKLIKVATMSGQEKYENEKERREVEKMAEGARQEAAAIRKEIERQQADIDNHLAIAKSFNDQAKRTRDFAELLREL
jgi:hypothetical protein